MKQSFVFSARPGTRAFTLIEVLVAVAIISILAAVVVVYGQHAQEQARDKERKVELKNLQVALKAYYLDHKKYPDGCRGTSWSGVPATGNFGCTNGKDYIVGLAPKYIATLPVDIKTASGQGFLYKTNSNNTGYKVLAYKTVETEFITSYDQQFARCDQQYATGPCTSNTPANTTYAVYDGADSASW